MSDSFFREMFEHLRHQRALPKHKHLATPIESSQDDPGRRIEWPQLLRFVIEAELARIGKEGQPYKKEVFIDRDKHSIKNEFAEGQHREALKVQRLYREVHRHGNGCLRLGDEDVLLVSYNVPNQGSHRRRCADLMGLRLDGSLVVFECKVKDNAKDNPFRAVLEGLDYLGHLAIPANIASFQKDFRVWHKKEREADSRSKIPADFRDVTVKSEARHAVIVLAPENYFTIHQRGNRHPDWHLLSDRALPAGTGLSAGLDFAITDFESTRCPLLTL